MTKFDKSQFVAFLHSLDRHLDAFPASMLIVGGAAALLGYDANVTTSDIDIFEGFGDILEAAEKARAETGLMVGVGPTNVAELPYNYEDRMRLLRGVKFSNLKVIVPGKYDLVISKALRGYPHDLDAIEAVHKQHPLSQKRLLDLFESEMMNSSISDIRKIQLNMAMVMGRLYGNKVGRKMALKWGVPIPSRG